MPETMKAKDNIITPGRTGELIGVAVKLHFMIKRLVTVEKKEMESLAMNIKKSAKPSTNANFAEFFKIKMNTFRAEEQKLSLEIAI